jgi:hypothetical protein
MHYKGRVGKKDVKNRGKNNEISAVMSAGVPYKYCTGGDAMAASPRIRDSSRLFF